MFQGSFYQLNGILHEAAYKRTIYMVNLVATRLKVEKENCPTTRSDRQHEMNLLATEGRLAINNICEVSN
jgi:hypothetical protein